MEEIRKIEAFLSTGSGSGYGSGIKEINGERVFCVDGVRTLIDRVRGNVAKGRVLCDDLTFAPCYVAKQGGFFAHGENLRDAMTALRDKLFEDMSEDDRIAAFVSEHKPDVEYSDADFYEWHHRLTGSCEMGRKEFARAHGLDKLDGKRTVASFIALTANAYGCDVIRKLIPFYKKEGDHDDEK